MGEADQAARLRQMMRERSEVPPQAAEDEGPGPARVMAITSGKGGVGKTNFAANLAIAFAALGRRVAVVDADYALANIDILLGFNPSYTIEHVLSGERSLGEIIVEGPGGIKVVPAASGVQNLSHLSERQRNLLFNALQVIEKRFQHVLIDTAAGISDNVISLLRSAGEVLVVTNPEPPAYVDSYALIKHLLSVQGDARVKVVVNSAESEADAADVFDRIADTVWRFLKRRIGYLGFVSRDDSVRKAVRGRRPFILAYPNSPASRCITALAHKLLESGAGRRGPGFWQKLAGVLGGQ